MQPDYSHVIEEAIRAVQRARRTPHLVINSLAAGVDVPGFIREQWGPQLVIDLDPSYPLDLVLDAIGVHATLSFGQTVHRCAFPWLSIYGVGDHQSGRTVLIGQSTASGFAVGAFEPQHAPECDMGEDCTCGASAGLPPKRERKLQLVKG